MLIRSYDNSKWAEYIGTLCWERTIPNDCSLTYFLSFLFPCIGYISLNHKIFVLFLNICLFSFNIFASGVHVWADKFKYAKSIIFHFLNFLMYDLFVS